MPSDQQKSNSEVHNEAEYDKTKERKNNKNIPPHHHAAALPQKENDVDDKAGSKKQNEERDSRGAWRQRGRQANHKHREAKKRSAVSMCMIVAPGGNSAERQQRRVWNGYRRNLKRAPNGAGPECFGPKKTSPDAPALHT